MDTITVEVWLYGPLSQYSGEKGSHAQTAMTFAQGSTVGDLVERLGIPAEERGITFVNGKLAALPGLQADLSVTLYDGDRIGIFHTKSIWPFQYRFGANLTPELQEAFRERDDRGIRHAYTSKPES
ncbi:MAG: MoaD/ThiS family protein [Anaerolineae bacterium]|nr:MoaD/ThiS family protein [Anaerolineae bacterium]